jgi:hypothetical protein
MKLALLSLLYLSLHITGVLTQEDPELPDGDGPDGDGPDGDVDIVVDFNTGIVDGVPLPGDLADLNFTTDTGRTIAQILMLNITSQGGTNVIDPSDQGHPCHKW